MSKLIDDMRSSLEMVGGSVGMTALFLAGLIALWYAKNEMKKETASLFWYALVSLIIVIDPFYYLFVERFVPGLLVDNRYLWIVLTIPVTLFSGVDSISMLKDTPKKIMFSVGLVIVLILAATTSYNRSSVNIGSSFISEENREVFDYVCTLADKSEDGTVCIWADDDMMVHARRYDGRLCTIYGRNDVDEKAEKLLEEAPGHETELASLAYEYGCDCVIVSRVLYEEAKIVPPDSMGKYYLEYYGTDYLIYITM